MTDTELRELVASLAGKHAELAEAQLESAEQIRETSRQLQETDHQLQATSRQQQETDRQLRETDRQVKELGRQIGGLGDKFGSFTEGLALPSLTKILGQRFGMDFIAPRARMRRNGHSMELDVLAFSNSRDDVFVVEVKSHLREEALEQRRKTLREFRDFFPDYRHKKVYGILAAVDAPDDLQRQVLAEGIYLARIHDGQFEIQVPDGFQARAY
ncbi:MAG TPA: DUF3782 domain-containing protein [Thermoanaerobaculia bacterium]|nr:DUF3782 domain-containing protein [Thermoanaerobaculia bacterium]